MLDFIFGWFNYAVHRLNNSLFFAGIIMLTLNIGARYIELKLDPSTENFLKTALTKEVLVFLNTSRLRELKEELKFPSIDAATLYAGQNLQILKRAAIFYILKNKGKFKCDENLPIIIHNCQSINDIEQYLYDSGFTKEDLLNIYKFTLYGQF